MEDILHSPDFIVPSKKLVIEINGRGKFYPLTEQKNNFLQFKTRLIAKSGYKILNLNSWRLDYWTKSEDGKDKINALIAKALTPSPDRYSAD